MATHNSTECKSCGGQLEYNPQSESLKCIQCGNTYPVNSISISNTKLEYNKDVSPKQATEDLSQYKCNNCGSTCVSGLMDSSMQRCPNCGSVELSKTVSVNIVPEGIIPFSYTKEEAQIAYNNWIKKRKFAPWGFKKKAKINSVLGVYYPTWNFDFTNFYKYSGVGVKKHRQGNNNVITTRHNFSDSFTNNYVNYLQHANTEVNGKYMREIGDFDFQNMKKYNSEFLYGWSGVKTNVDIHSAYNTTFKEIDSANERTARANEGHKYSGIEHFQGTTSLSNVYFNNVYLPIWTANYRYKNKIYNCYVNGSTGKTGGKSPISVTKVLLVVLGILAIIGGLIYLTR